MQHLIGMGKNMMIFVLSDDDDDFFQKIYKMKLRKVGNNGVFKTIG